METLFKIKTTPVLTATDTEKKATATTGDIIQIQPERTYANLQKLSERLIALDKNICVQGPKLAASHSFKGNQEGVVIGNIENGLYQPIQQKKFNIQDPEDFTIGTVVLMQNLRPLCPEAYIITAIDDERTINYFQALFKQNHQSKHLLQFLYRQPQLPILSYNQYKPSIAFLHASDMFLTQNPELVGGYNASTAASIIIAHAQIFKLAPEAKTYRFTSNFSLKFYHDKIIEFVDENVLLTVASFLGNGRIGVLALDPLGENNIFRFTHKRIIDPKASINNTIDLKQLITDEVSRLKIELYQAIDPGVFELLARQPISKDFAIRFWLNKIIVGNRPNKELKSAILEVFNEMCNCNLDYSIASYSKNNFIEEIVLQSCTYENMLFYYDKISRELTNSDLILANTQKNKQFKALV